MKTCHHEHIYAQPFKDDNTLHAFIRNHFISNLVLDNLKFKKFLEPHRKELRNFTKIVHLNRNLVQRKPLPKQCEYDSNLARNIKKTFRTKMWPKIKKLLFLGFELGFL